MIADYLRHVWARRRLPPRGVEWTHEHQIVRKPPADARGPLPFGRTCNNVLELPEYVSEEVLRMKLLKAINETRIEEA